MATYNACQTEYYLHWKNGGVKIELDRKTKHVCRISGGLTQSSVGGYRPMNRYSAFANNIGGFNCYGKKQPETMTGVGLPMKKLRPLLALVVPLFLLVSMPLLLTHAQAQQEEGNGIWRLTMIVTDVPSNIPSIVLEIYKGSGFPAQSLSSPVVDVEDGTATGTVDVSTNDISDGDTYSVCYQGQYADGNDDAHAYCSDAKIHHGENGHVTLSSSYGETM